MPIIDKNNPNDWHNLLPVAHHPQKNPLEDPDFDIAHMEGNEFDQGNGTIIAKVPEIKGRIFRDNKGKSDTFIVLLTDRYKDPTDPNHIIHNRVTIGTELFGRWKGLMVASPKYHEYFDTDGNLVNDPLKHRKEAEARGKEEQEAIKRAEAEKRKAEQKAAKENKDSKYNTTAQPGPDEERTVDEIKAALTEQERSLKEREKRLKQQEDMLIRKIAMAEDNLQTLRDKQNELDAMIEYRKYALQEKYAAHLSLLNDILIDFQRSVHEQAKRKPDSFMRLKQIQTINEILKELQELFAGTEAEDYLHLAEEPDENDREHRPGTTYGEMDLLLGAYYNTISACKCGKLYWKDINTDS